MDLDGCEMLRLCGLPEVRFQLPEITQVPAKVIDVAIIFLGTLSGWGMTNFHFVCSEVTDEAGVGTTHIHRWDRRNLMGWVFFPFVYRRFLCVLDM